MRVAGALSVCIGCFTVTQGSLAAEAASSRATSLDTSVDTPTTETPDRRSLAERYWKRKAREADSRQSSLAYLVPSLGFGGDAGYCRGEYAFPPVTLAADVEASTLPVEAEAERGSYRMGESAELAGNVRLQQGDRTLTGDAVSIDLATQVARFDTPIELIEPQVILSGARATTQLASRETQLEGAEILLNATQFRATADRVDLSAAGDLSVDRLSLTRCPPGNRSWRVTASNFQIDEGSPYARVRNATLRVAGVPMFYLPYARFPASDDRLSGWLFPNFGYSDEDGVDLAVPYYFNLAPNYDLTLTPRWIGERGTGLEAQTRYLDGYGQSAIYGAFMANDDLYNGEFDRSDFAELFPEEPFDGADRWLYGMSHNGSRALAGGQLRTFVDYTAVSDGDYFRDLGTDIGISSRVQLQRFGEAVYRNGNLEARLWAQRFQVLDAASRSQYERLPEVTLSYGGRLPLGLRWSAGAALANFDRDTRNLSGLNAVTGTRLHLTPRLELPLSWPFGFLDVAAGYLLTRYDLDSDGVTGLADDFEDKPSREAGFGRIDGGLVFERPVSPFGTQLVQTLEPRLYYLHQGFVDQSTLPLFDTVPLTFQYRQLFRENRFSGVDRIGDANQLSVGLTTRLLSERNGREWLRASVGQIRFFRDREVALLGSASNDDRLRSSAVATEMAGTITTAFRWSGVVLWDPQDGEVDESSVTLGWQPAPNRILNVGYRQRRLGDIDQTDVSLYWPIGRRFAVLGRWNYDLETGRTIEGIGGLEYNDCCWKVRLVARRFIENPSASEVTSLNADEGIELQIVFRGLAGFGNRLESILERSIRGYQAAN
ncbi:MAG: LPS assembly protein LptD [Pseudomonadota bacterium]